ncbi:hypothetical protein GF322_04790 [Candidatus Dependentiae bacterium]|nr:hypothetical protein [Candidatus Dependentiae bacterium]
MKMEAVNNSNIFKTFVEWIKEVWEKINIKEWAESIGGTSSEAVQASIYFGVGFAIGFLFKKYFKFLISCLLISIFLILILEYNKILEIDWQAFNVWIGFEPTADLGVILNSIFDWIKDNLLVSVSSTVGFLIGYKLG